MLLDIDYTESEILDVVQKVFSCISEQKSSQATLVLLKGDLGSGKTTFVKNLGMFLGIKDMIHSPTYTLCKSYKTHNTSFKNLVHIDAYRIEDDITWDILKMEEILSYPDTLICIEWPEMLPKLFLYPHVMIELSHKDEANRHLSLTYHEKIEPL